MVALDEIFLGFMMLFHSFAMTLSLIGKLSDLMKNQGVLPLDYEHTDFEQHLLTLLGASLHSTMVAGGLLALTTKGAQQQRTARVGAMLLMESILTTGITYANYIHGFVFHQSGALAAISWAGTIAHFVSEEKKTKAS